VQKLEKAIDMRTTGSMSATIAMSGKVDLESNTKGQASRVDVVKLAKAEAKIKVRSYCSYRADADNFRPRSRSELVVISMKAQSSWRWPRSKRHTRRCT
jgi:ATP-binding cassette subfamily F protein 3